MTGEIQGAAEEATEEVTTIQKVKLAAGIGAVAVGHSMEAGGMRADNPYETIGGLVVIAAGALYALRQFPESSKRLMREIFLFQGDKRQ